MFNYASVSSTSLQGTLERNEDKKHRASVDSQHPLGTGGTRDSAALGII